MTNEEQDAGVYDATAARTSRRRKQTVAGVVGLAAVLGGAAFVVTDRLSEDAAAVATETGARAPAVPPATEPSTPEAEAPAASTAASPSKAAAKRTSSPSPSPLDTRSAVERVKAARAAAAKDGQPVQRGLTPEPGAVAAGGPVEVTNEGSLKEGGTLRVITAQHDLTGQRELLWAADDGKPVGSAHCTQNFHFSNDGKAKVRPTMLLCWRTSAGKSVVTVAVVRTGRPSTAASVAVIDRRWAEMG